MIPAGFALESKIYVSIIAVNRIGRSAAIAQTFYPVVVPSAPCYVDANALAQNPDAVGPHMRDNMDVFGKDWVKFWSPDQSTRAETRSAAACCLTCEAYDGCSYWTYHKDSFGCYLKHQDDVTVYSDQASWCSVPTCTISPLTVFRSFPSSSSPPQIDVGRISGYLSPNMHNEDKHNGPTNWDVDAVGWNPDILGNRRRLTDSPPVLNVGEHPHLAGVDFAGNDWVKVSVITSSSSSYFLLPPHLPHSLSLSLSLSLTHTHTQSRYYPGSNDSLDSRGGTPRSRLISPFATYDGTISGGSGWRTISGGSGGHISGGSGGLYSPPNTMSGSSDSGGWLFAPSPTKNVDSN